jgi:predicted MPP superfamily phosphohydrolase
MLAQAGIAVLHNESRHLSVGNWRLAIAGVGDLWNRELDASAAFANVVPETVNVLLCHNPDAKSKVRDFPWDLMLCGHTHGGQCKIPFVGTPFAPVRDHRFVEGLHRWEERWLHVSKGVGNLHGLRFNCRPEVSLLTLT